MSLSSDILRRPMEPAHRVRSTPIESAPPVRRVVVGVSGSLANLAAPHAAARLARRCEATLVAVYAWAPPGGEVAYRRAPSKPLADHCRELPRRTVDDAFIDAFGGPPPDIDITTVFVGGLAGAALVS